ncbi:PAAR-like domain-containing protein [Vibrio quintilis]|uniref:Tox-GHH2 domain-containing protein n=1 Tax=Vibrio quintilis TaxID=1117707 RepID=A0A1M7YVX5_9VIBR|nr:PAAR-like domain-containing protein [Vibrio quintilis]SHO56850.1 hypothetical protein VQ7734_02619 [Vibrio quintilis]
MAKNTVFANGREVACKISSGKSTAAFPDPCWSPPTPPTGPVVIPYANSSYAKDLSNGSKTVLIGQKPVFLKDKSFIKTSTGNEGATQSQSKAIVTGVITGKTYFTSWSMNVMAEGFNLPRHMDLTTHNHGSGANTITWPFIADSEAQGQPCKSTKEKAQKACEVSDDDNEKFKKDRKQGGFKSRNMTWKDKHCQKLEFVPAIESLKTNVAKVLDCLKTKSGLPPEIQTTFYSTSNSANAAINVGEAICESLDYIAKTCRTANISNEHLNKLLVHTMKAKGFREFSDDLKQTPEAKNLDSYNKKYNNSKSSKETDEYKKLKNDFDKIKDEHKNKKEYQDALEDTKKKTKQMTEDAKNNECLKARKCLLVPYNDNSKISKDKKKISESYPSDDKFSVQKGCCPGQTGHHVIPELWAKKACKKKRKESDKHPIYQNAQAPTVCAEGNNGEIGGHGDLHAALNKRVSNHRGRRRNKDKTITLEDAIKMTALAHHSAIGQKSGCKMKCTKAQLTSYYKKECQCGDMLPQMRTGNKSDNNSQQDGIENKNKGGTVK